MKRLRFGPENIDELEAIGLSTFHAPIHILATKDMKQVDSTTSGGKGLNIKSIWVINAVGQSMLS